MTFSLSPRCSRYSVRLWILPRLCQCLPCSLSGPSAQRECTALYASKDPSQNTRRTYTTHTHYRLTLPHFLRSSGPPQLPFPNNHYHLRELNVIDSSSLHFRTRTTSGGSLPDRMVVEPFVLPTATEPMQQSAVTSADCVSGAASSSNATLTVPAKSKSRDAYRLSWHRPVDPPARSFG